jgi:hypothetical protein
MKKISYFAAAFAMTISLALISCNKNDDEDASMLPPSATRYDQSVAESPVFSGTGFNPGDSLQNSSSCRCPGPDLGSDN